MNYATVEDLTRRFGVEIQQVAESKAEDPTDDSPLDAVLTDASRLIDSYLRLRHAVPIQPVPEVLVGVCCDIARFKLHDDHAGEEISGRYKTAIAWLRDVADGKATLGEDDTTATGVGRVVRRQGRSGFDWGAHSV